MDRSKPDNNDEDGESVAMSTTTGVASKGAGAAWTKYVSTFLPLERAIEFSKEEMEIVNGIVKGIGSVLWEKLPRDIQINIIRGNCHEKERLKASANSAKLIAEWRAKYNVDAEMLSVGPLPGSDEFFTGWPTKIAGSDEFGHPVMYDRFLSCSIPKLLSMGEGDLFKYRTQGLEAVMYAKQELTQKIGARVSKHVYLLDMAGFDPTKHFSSAIQKKIQPLMKMASDIYPETLWTVWVINAPASFRFIWAIVRGWLDPLVRAKIRIWGSVKSKYLPAMAECGLPLTALPVECGGSSKCETLPEILVRAAAMKAASASISAVTAAPEPSTATQKADQ